MLTYSKLPQTNNKYYDTSIVELTRFIVEDSDRTALKVFHDHRPIFQFNDSAPLLFVEFAESLCGSRWALQLAGSNYNLLEKTYDHLIDRFSNIPTDTYPEGPDCRYYFNSFLGQFDRLCEQQVIENPLEKELLAGRILQNMVIKNCIYCLKESQRCCNPLRSRYEWPIDGEVVVVWVPMSIPGSVRRTRLQELIPDADPKRPGEKYRIQRIIDEVWGIPSLEHSEFLEEFIYDGYKNSGHESVLPDEQQIEVKGLADAVADEKSDNIDRMRPAIRQLGPGKLRRLIQQIFSDIADGTYQEKTLAGRFNISGATFTRFAGSRWRISSDSRCPDLWSNLAQTLSQHKSFTEAAKQCRIWESVLQIIEITS